MAVDKKSREELAAEQARKEAELFVKGKSKEEIEKELKRMDKGPGFLGWVRDRINGFLNFILSLSPFSFLWLFIWFRKLQIHFI